MTSDNDKQTSHGVQQPANPSMLSDWQTQSNENNGAVPSTRDESRVKSQASKIELLNLLFQGIGTLAVVFAAIGLWIDFRAREADRINRAWALVGQQVGLKGALEFLNGNGEDLSNLKLHDAHLPGIDLRGANLTGADLTRCNFEGADLSNVNFDRAIMKNTDLSEAKLNGANLLNADFSGAFMEIAELNRAQLQHTNLTKAHLLDVQLKGAVLFGANFKDAVYTSTEQLLEESVLNWAVMPDGETVSNGDFGDDFGDRIIK